MLKPIDDRVLIEKVNNNETSSGIYIPGEDNKFTVIETGDNVKEVSKGDIVVVTNFSGRTELNYQDKIYNLIQESDILAIIENE